MRRTPLVFLWLPVVLAMLPACTHNPRMLSGTESDYLLQLRQEYLTSNPDGEYNAYIERGEVVKGMDILEVLASWGHPDKRRKRTARMEAWTYREVDEVSKDWIVYTFTFRQNVLSDWDLTRHFASGGTVDLLRDRPPSSLTKGEYTGATQTDDAPRKGQNPY